jgi:hypothetical protein
VAKDLSFLNPPGPAGNGGQNGNGQGAGGNGQGGEFGGGSMYGPPIVTGGQGIIPTGPLDAAPLPSTLLLGALAAVALIGVRFLPGLNF